MINPACTWYKDFGSDLTGSVMITSNDVTVELALLLLMNDLIHSLTTRINSLPNRDSIRHGNESLLMIRLVTLVHREVTDAYGDTFHGISVLHAHTGAPDGNLLRNDRLVHLA
jgi:hypothetical protein